TADLNAATGSAKGAITYRPGDEALVGSEPVVNFTAEGPFGAVKRAFDSEPLAQFLTQRALEKEQQRVEAMQAALLEKQRLRREVRYYAALQDARDKAAEELRRQEEAARLKAEADAKAKAEADAQAQAEADAKAQADAKAKAKADADAKAKADADAKAAAEKQAADEAAKAQAEQERQKAEEAMRIASQEKARLEAERKAAQPPKVERAPLPQANDNPPPAKPKANPFTIDNLLKSLQ
ncbi:AsmA protein, partial [Mesorhizobium sp. M7A.F.Ca.US.007.01.1.1]